MKLPPVASASRRSPRRQTVIAASRTKNIISNRLNWPTSTHGFETPTPLETDSPSNRNAAGGNLVEVEILPHQEIQQQRQRPESADGPGEPGPPGPQVEPDETDE